VRIGFSAGVQRRQGMAGILANIARMYLWGLLPGGKRTRFYSINVMRARHPEWFKEDLSHLFELLRSGAIHPRVAERISFDKVADARAALEKANARMLLGIRQVLTPEQWSMLNVSNKWIGGPGWTVVKPKK